MNKKEQDKVNEEKKSKRLADVIEEVGGDFVWMMRCLPKVVGQELAALRTRKRTKR